MLRAANRRRTLGRDRPSFTPPSVTAIEMTPTHDQHVATFAPPSDRLAVIRRATTCKHAFAGTIGVSDSVMAQRSMTEPSTGALGDPNSPRRRLRVPDNDASKCDRAIAGMLGVTRISCAKRTGFSPICTQLIHNRLGFRIIVRCSRTRCVDLAPIFLMKHWLLLHRTNDY